MLLAHDNASDLLNDALLGIAQALGELDIEFLRFHKGIITNNRRSESRLSLIYPAQSSPNTLVWDEINGVAVPVPPSGGIVAFVPIVSKDEDRVLRHGNGAQVVALEPLVRTRILGIPFLQLFAVEIDHFLSQFDRISRYRDDPLDHLLVGRDGSFERNEVIAVRRAKEIGRFIEHEMGVDAESRLHRRRGDIDPLEEKVPQDSRAHRRDGEEKKQPFYTHIRIVTAPDLVRNLARQMLG